VNRNFEVFDPLDFLAAVTARIPNRGERLVPCPRRRAHCANSSTCPGWSDPYRAAGRQSAPPQRTSPLLRLPGALLGFMSRPNLDFGPRQGNFYGKENYSGLY